MYIWLICIIPSFLSGFYLTKTSDKFEFKIFGYFNLSYVFAAIISILFMRESLNFSGTHTAHSYLIMPFFTISSIVLILISKNFEIYNRVINRYLFIVFTFAFILFNHFNISENKIRLNDVKNFSSSKEVTMTYNESQSFFLKNEKVCTNNSSLISKFSSKHIDKDGCGSKSVELLYSALNGRRTNAGLDNDFLKMGDNLK